jgi:hypothetical protein
MLEERREREKVKKKKKKIEKEGMRYIYINRLFI